MRQSVNPDPKEFLTLLAEKLKFSERNINKLSSLWYRFISIIAVCTMSFRTTCICSMRYADRLRSDNNFPKWLRFKENTNSISLKFRLVKSAGVSKLFYDKSFYSINFKSVESTKVSTINSYNVVILSPALPEYDIRLSFTSAVVK